MMTLSETEILLIRCLKYLGCSKAEALYIVMSLEFEEEQLELLAWINEHQDATPTQLCEMSSKIYSKSAPSSLENATA